MTDPKTPTPALDALIDATIAAQHLHSNRFPATQFRIYLSPEYFATCHTELTPENATYIRAEFLHNHTLLGYPIHVALPHTNGRNELTHHPQFRITQDALNTPSNPPPPHRKLEQFKDF